MAKQVSWIVGASSGIGEATARAAAAKGYSTILSARRTERLEDIRGRLSGSHTVVPLDLESTELEKVVDGVWSTHGPVDLAVIAAGVSQRALATDTTPAVVRRLLSLNLEAAVRLGASLADHMVKRGSGAIVAVSSLAGLVPAPYRSAYAAAKHGLHGYFTTLNAELADSGVAVRLVVPGFVATEISRSALQADGLPYGTSDVAQARGASPDVVARAILRAPRRRRGVIYVALGLRGRLAILLSRRFPVLYDRVAMRRESRARRR